MTIFYLILTFYSGSYGGTSAAVVPAPFLSVDTCNVAGATAKANYTGGAKVDYSCAPAPASQAAVH